MKKVLAIMTVLALMVTVAATAALAEETAAPTFTSGVQFNMDMDQVMQLVNLPNPEIENERTRGPVMFEELEYENVASDDGLTGDVKFSFIGNSLIAIRYDLREGASYETVRETLVKEFGEAVPFDETNIGNARYVIDDDGNLRDCKEMIVRDDLIVVLEQDYEGDVDVTILDPTAAYINN